MEGSPEQGGDLRQLCPGQDAQDALRPGGTDLLEE